MVNFWERGRIVPTDPKDNTTRVRRLTEVAGRIRRFPGLEMVHPTNLLIHLHRVRFLTTYLGIILSEADSEGTGWDEAFENDFGLRNLLEMSAWHDHPELITGDIPTMVKEKMSQEERKALAVQEQQASRKIGRFLGLRDDNLESYLAVVGEATGKKTLEAQIVHTADYWDALCEVWHEIRCGNDSFLPILDRYHQRFLQLKQHVFWQVLESDPCLMFKDIPTSEEAKTMPRLTFEDVAQADDIERVLVYPSMPAWYKTWCAFSLIAFSLNQARHLFPGWYPELEKRWDERGSIPICQPDKE